jgi:feruloyl esterase
MNNKNGYQPVSYTKRIARMVSGVVVLVPILTISSTAIAEPKPVRNCEQLANLKVYNKAGESYTNLLSAKVVSSTNLPEYCRVLGYIRPAINFEVRLPTKNWNGKFYMVGCSGFCGKVEADQPGFYNAINYGLKRNYAVSTMDSGHRGTSPTDARWAYNNRLAEIDWGYRAVHETAYMTKELITAYFGEKPKLSYFQGCSNGGRMANKPLLRGNQRWCVETIKNRYYYRFHAVRT